MQAMDDLVKDITKLSARARPWLGLRSQRTPIRGSRNGDFDSAAGARSSTLRWSLRPNGQAYSTHRHTFSARKCQQQPAHQGRTADERSRLVEKAGRGKRDEGERGKRDIDRKDVSDHLADGEAAVGRALIKVRAVRLPHLFAADQAARERDGRVGEIIERQQDCGWRVRRGRRAAHQEPAEQQTDRQAADIAEEKPGDWPVEIGKADHGAAQGEADDGRQRRQEAACAENRQRRGDRHDFGDRHPIEAVHEIDQIDEPEPAEGQQQAFNQQRQERRDPQFIRQSEDHQRHADGLQKKARRNADRADVVRGTHGRDDDHGDEERQHRCRAPRPPGRTIKSAGGRDDGRGDNRDAAALRRRHAVRGARIRLGERDAFTATAGSRR